MKDKTFNREEIIEYAKELYLTMDEDGRHKYSLRDIALQIKQKFNKTINHSTIKIWADKFGWDKLWKHALQEGIVQAISVDTNKSKEEQIKEAIAKQKQEDFTLNVNLRRKAYQYLMEHEFFSIKDALLAFDIASKNLRDVQFLEEAIPVIRVEFVNPIYSDEDK